MMQLRLPALHMKTAVGPAIAGLSRVLAFRLAYCA